MVNGKVASVSRETLPGVLRTTPDKATLKEKEEVSHHPPCTHARTTHPRIIVIVQRSSKHHLIQDSYAY